MFDTLAGRCLPGSIARSFIGNLRMRSAAMLRFA
jgi:hypothetical protein